MGQTPSPLQALAKDVLRRLGISDEPKPKPSLRFSDKVNVTGTMPNYNDPYPPGIDEIIFGTKTKRPTGSYVDDSHPQLDIINKNVDLPLFKAAQRRFGIITPTGDKLSSGKYDWLNEAYHQFLEQYPYAKFIPSGIYPSNDMVGLNADGGYNSTKNRIVLNPQIAKRSQPYVSGVIAHEITHNSQRNNFINEEDYDKGWSWPQPYEYNPIEGLPNAVEEGVSQKMFKAYDEKQRREHPEYYLPIKSLQDTVNKKFKK